MRHCLSAQFEALMSGSQMDGRWKNNTDHHDGDNSEVALMRHHLRQLTGHCEAHVACQ